MFRGLFGAIRVEVVAGPLHPAALLDPGHLDRDVGPRVRIGDDVPIDAQPGHAAVRLQGQPHVGVPALIVDPQEIVRIGFQGSRFDDGSPLDPWLSGIVEHVQHARVDPAAGGMVAGEEPGVDVHRA
jgi:hypothetical protein